MSERVRIAMALDAIEKVTERCCEMAATKAREASHVQTDLAFDIIGAIYEAAVIYGVDHGTLEREAWKMLRNGLNRSLRPICEVMYVKPHEVGGKTVGMAVRFYKVERSVA